MQIPDSFLGGDGYVEGAKPLVFRPATIKDARSILPRLRQADLDEFQKLWPGDIIEQIADGIERGAWSLSAVLDGQVECIFGVGPAYLPEGGCISGLGIPWLIGTDAVDEHAVIFLRHSRAVVRHMQRDFGELINVVSGENTKTIAWLRWLGFRLEPDGAGNFIFRRSV